MITFDRMRADVAAALDMAPEALAPEDNLYDLGLDSMQLMALVMEWQEQGVELDFGLLMESQTVGAWWDAVAAGRAGA